MLKYIFLIVLLCYAGPSLLLQAQETTEQQSFVINRLRILDHENVFTAREIQQLDSILQRCWEQGIADIFILTIDDRHTDIENFDDYVYNNLTQYAVGGYGKNNGIVIAISKKLRRMRIENGYGIEKVLSNEATKRIIDEQFIPAFKAGNYFEGTANGLDKIIDIVQQVLKQHDYEQVSSIFRPSIFKKIREFVLENGSPQTFRNLDSDNPSYNFTSLDVFFGPARKHSFVLKDFLDNDYYELTIRDNDGSYYHFVYFDESTPEQTFIHPDMQPGSVYWWHPGEKLLSQDVWPLLAQLEDEISQTGIVHDAKSFQEYPWVLKQAFHPMERRYTDVDHTDTLVFHNNQFTINGVNAGTFTLDTEKRLLALQVAEGKPLPFAQFEMDGYYYYRYLFNKKESKLYLVPLDETAGTDLVCVEGCTLLFEMLAN